jgi:hypothetical protein
MVPDRLFKGVKNGKLRWKAMRLTAPKVVPLPIGDTGPDARRVARCWW